MNIHYFFVQLQRCGFRVAVFPVVKSNAKGENCAENVEEDSWTVARRVLPMTTVVESKGRVFNDKKCYRFPTKLTADNQFFCFFFLNRTRSWWRAMSGGIWMRDKTCALFFINICIRSTHSNNTLDVFCTRGELLWYVSSISFTVLVNPTNDWWYVCQQKNTAFAGCCFSFFLPSSFICRTWKNWR